MTRLAQSGHAVASVDVRFRGRSGQHLRILDHWLHPIREITHAHQSELDAIAEPRARLDRLCELNVSQQVRNVASDVFRSRRVGTRSKAFRARLDLLDYERPPSGPRRNREPTRRIVAMARACSVYSN